MPLQLVSLPDVLDQLSVIELPPLAGAGAAPAPRIVQMPLRASTSRQPLTAQQEQELELEQTPVAALAERLWNSTSLEEQSEVLEQLVRRLGPHAVLQGPGTGVPLRLPLLVDEVYRRALAEGDWNVVRRCAGVMGLVHPQLEDALIDLLVRQKQVVVGRNYTHDSLITEPASSLAIADRIRRYSGDDGREWMLQQELLLALDGLARLEPSLLSGSLTLQLGQLLLLLTGELATEFDLCQSDAFERLCGLPPTACAAACGPCWPMWSTPGPRCSARSTCTCAAGALGGARSARGAAQGGRLDAAPPAAGGAAAGAARFLCGHLGSAAPLRRPGDRRQAGAPQPARERAAAE